MEEISMAQLQSDEPLIVSGDPFWFDEEEEESEFDEEEEEESERWRGREGQEEGNLFQQTYCQSMLQVEVNAPLCSTGAEEYMFPTRMTTYCSGGVYIFKC